MQKHAVKQNTDDDAYSIVTLLISKYIAELKDRKSVV